MKIAFIVPSYVDQSDFLAFKKYAICLINQAEGLASLGLDIHIISRFPREFELTENNIKFHFITDQLSPSLKPWQISVQLLKKITSISASIVHFHGLNHYFLIGILSRIVKNTVVEFHSDNISSKLQFLYPFLFARVCHFIFGNDQDAQKWKVATKNHNYSIIQECAFKRRYMDRGLARQKTNFNGKPIFISNSRMINRRNHLAVLYGFEAFMKENKFPESKFYIMLPDFDSQLLNLVEQRIENSDLLSKSVVLIKDKKEITELDSYYNSADYVISGSEYDGYGLGIADTMSCGVLPIVTDISTFREITQNGKIGKLFTLKEKNSLPKAINDYVGSSFPNIKAESKTIVDFYHANLSIKSQAQKLLKVYEKVLDQKLS